jgi:hypothetical protein
MTVWTDCHCNRPHSTARGFLRCKVPSLGSIAGNGDWALVAWCPRDKYAVTLTETDSDAHRLRSNLNLYGCGPDCRRAHAVIHLNYARKAVSA